MRRLGVSRSSSINIFPVTDMARHEHMHMRVLAVGGRLTLFTIETKEYSDKEKNERRARPRMRWLGTIMTPSPGPANETQQGKQRKIKERPCAMARPEIVSPLAVNSLPTGESVAERRRRKTWLLRGWIRRNRREQVGEDTCLMIGAAVRDPGRPSSNAGSLSFRKKPNRQRHCCHSLSVGTVQKRCELLRQLVGESIEAFSSRPSHGNVAKDLYLDLMFDVALPSRCRFCLCRRSRFALHLPLFLCGQLDQAKAFAPTSPPTRRPIIRALRSLTSWAMRAATSTLSTDSWAPYAVGDPLGHQRLPADKSTLAEARINAPRSPRGAARSKARVRGCRRPRRRKRERFQRTLRRSPLCAAVARVAVGRLRARLLSGSWRRVTSATSAGDLLAEKFCSQD
ncbi:hypothetical protein BIW11_04814 [Tropilaelaps mercedesae]|uniref:Uncharacterized protein n=1 Tax=Tropilaelaps mercedesae TaxID=418985 RepID=A0A1V9X1C2_9ACAR|nr:hypothetical protein BIW11_04814 [Tropilaelaps mercedesae]